MSTAAAWLILLLIGRFALHRAIRRGLAAPHIVGQQSPGALPWRAVDIPTVRGLKLFGWHITAGEGAPSLVILHGWGGNAEMMLPLAGPLHAAGYGLLFIEARNHGRSDPDDFSSLPRFAEDLEAAIDWLQHQPGTDPQRIGVIGHSVGAGAALLAASRRQDIRVVISLAAFAHPEVMMRRWLAAKGIPYWPIGAYILHYVQRVIGHRYDDIAPCNTIARIGCPVLLVHGRDDDTVPVEDAFAIYQGRASEQVRLLLIAGKHDEFADLGRHLIQMIEFLDLQMRR